MSALTAVDRRWAGVGRAAGSDPQAAGASAARQALTGEAAALLIVFCDDGWDVAALLAGIREVAPDVPLIGCTTAGEIARDGVGDRGVVITALGGPGFAIRTAAAVAEDGDMRTAAATATAAVHDPDALDPPVLLILSDGLVGDQEAVVLGAYGVAGARVPMIGGCAGDGSKMERTFQLHGDAGGDRVLQGAVVVAAVSSDGPTGVGVAHGWSRVGSPVRVTGTEGTTVVTLDGRPALDVYLDHLDAPDDVRTDPAAFAGFAASHPLGIPRRTREEVRFIAGADHEARTLQCIAQVPQGGLAWVMRGSADSVLDATDLACAQAVAGLGGEPAKVLLAFDCVARRGVLHGDGTEEEVRRLRTHAGDAAVAGFYTYGEFARTKGVNGFHNQTLVVLALA